MVRIREKRTLLHCWWEHKLVQPLWKTAWRFLKKLKPELPYDPEIPLLGIYPKELKSGSKRDTCSPMFTAAFSTITETWKQLKCPSTDEWWIKMNDGIYTHATENYLSLKKKEILPFATTWMDLKGIMLSEISQKQKDKYCIVTFMCGI